MVIKIMLDGGAKMPTKAHDADAGFDLYLPTDYGIQTVPAHGNLTVTTGVHMMIPEGYCGIIQPKSGLNVKSDLLSFGLVDAGYTGGIVAKIYNMGEQDYTFYPGDKLTQIVVSPIPHVRLVEVDSLEDTDRGNNGFGSSGK